MTDTPTPPDASAQLAERLTQALLQGEEAGYTAADVERGLPLLLMAAAGQVPVSSWPAPVREWLTASLQNMGVEPPFDGEASLKKLSALMDDLNPNLTKSFGRVLREHVLETQTR